MKNVNSMIRRCSRGFSLIEMMIAVSIMLILIAIVSPTLMTHVYAMRIRHAASELSGILQRTRMEAARKNTFYSLQQTVLAGNATDIFIDIPNTGILAPTDPQVILASPITASYGPGGPAPNQVALTAALNFAPAAGGPPSFNARGLPCVPVGLICPWTAGQGFLFFVSGPTSSGGSVGWAAVAVTPSGRSEVWTYDGANWNQQ